MKTGFKDPIATKDAKSIKNPWSFECPVYDQRSGCYVSAGDDHGVGHKNPIGTQHPAKGLDAVIPKGRVNTLSLYPDK